MKKIFVSCLNLIFCLSVGNCLLAAEGKNVLAPLNNSFSHVQVEESALVTQLKKDIKLLNTELQQRNSELADMGSMIPALRDAVREMSKMVQEMTKKGIRFR